MARVTRGSRSRGVPQSWFHYLDRCPDQSERGRYKSPFTPLPHPNQPSKPEPITCVTPTKKHQGKRSKGYEYLLRGLVRCECGAKMHGRITRRRKNGKVYAKRKYICAAYDSNGTCKHNWADADQLHERVVNELVKAIRDPANLERLTAMMNKKSAQPPELEPQIQFLTRRLAELDREIEAGTARVLKVPEDLLEGVYKVVRQLKEQRHQVEAELASHKSQAQRVQPDVWSKDHVLARITKLADQTDTVISDLNKYADTVNPEPRSG